VAAACETTDFAVARWVSCRDRKKLEEFQKQNLSNTAVDAEGNLIYLATSEWRLSYMLENWPDIEIKTTMEHHGTAAL